MERVTLLTDFGGRDAYVAAVKGVIASRAPGVHLDDAGHDVPRGDVASAARALAGYWNRYPAGTVHLVVVDPGVGTRRRAIALEADGRFVVAPDNGVSSGVLEAATSWRAVEISNPALLPANPSRTFHGRDVFAPAAAHLALGRELSPLGAAVERPVRLPISRPVTGDGEATGEVVGVDRFGNLVTNLPGEVVAGGAPVRVEGREVPVAGTYGDVGSGELLALVNSEGRLEVAVRDGSAADVLGVGPGARVRIGRTPG